eukprot:TRINITY_DN3092_c0_g1_i1.p1 TRINITY_DN3092_c0_g1~~TRINITY_DN3092_c0_g1_i1.p1  ORF type:complete len:70 (+),score=7.95 TRINITY_DN3092_c0_g1_i1:114-323(+)
MARDRHLCCPIDQLELFYSSLEKVFSERTIICLSSWRVNGTRSNIINLIPYSIHSAPSRSSETAKAHRG